MVKTGEKEFDYPQAKNVFASYRAPAIPSTSAFRKLLFAFYFRIKHCSISPAQVRSAFSIIGISRVESAGRAFLVPDGSHW